MSVIARAAADRLPRQPHAGQLRQCALAVTRIVIDANAGLLNLDVAPEEIERRLAEWTPPSPKYTTGVFAKYCALVASASEGAVTSTPQLAALAAANRR